MDKRYLAAGLVLIIAWALAQAIDGSRALINNSVPLGKLQVVAQDTLLGRVSSGTGSLEQLTPAQARALLGLTGTVFAASPNTDVAINNATPQVLVSRSLPGLAAGHTVILEVWYTVLNNSGAVATYTYRCGLGGVTTQAADSTTHAASATNRAVHYAQCKFSVFSTTATRLWLESRRGVPGAANTAQTGAQASRYSWQTTASNLTGTQTAEFAISSSTTTATQTANVESWRITVQPSNP